MKTTIFTKLTIEGLHRWKDCNLEEVGYLKNTHRHIFHITCEKDVTGLDRELEFVRFKHEVDFYIRHNYYMPYLGCCSFGNMSCEMIAKELVKEFNLSSCEVSEDNENGAKIIREL
jgi:hypothetical protein